jgi:cation diffusion facilitator CzcD-associated flavoprotein CzcO
MMPRDPGDAAEYPSRAQAIAYLTEYERRYELPVDRPVRVHGVHRDSAGLVLDTTAGRIRARAVVSATGTWANPIVPEISGQDEFSGFTTHSGMYDGPATYVGKRVLVVGGGNSGAQIFAELSLVADATWVTRDPPSFLPDEVDGRYLFEQATVRYRALQEGRTPDPPRSLGDIVMVPPVRAARERGVLVAQPMFAAFTSTGVVWSDGREERVDAVIYATGFRPALGHLDPLGVVGADGRVEMAPDVGTRSAAVPRLWLVGYGEWTGFASATLIGVGRSARATVDDVVQALAAGG